MPREILIRRIATAVTLICVAVVAVTIAAIVLPPVRSKLGLVPVRPPAYRVGDRIDLPRDVYDASSLTVLVFIRSNCPSCARSQPMFKTIANDLGGTPARMRVVVSNARPETEAAYAEALGLASTSLVAVDFSSLHLQAVPTLLLVNRGGEVLYALEGPPSDQQRDELLRLVRANVQAG